MYHSLNLTAQTVGYIQFKMSVYWSSVLFNYNREFEACIENKQGIEDPRKVSPLHAFVGKS